jgi:uncharacterized protein (TIGR00369 family)
MPRMTIEEIERFIDEQFPQARAMAVTIEALGDDGSVRVRLRIGDHHLRPGGTVSGPSLMALADTAMYYAVLAAIGPVGLAVTTSLHIDFLRRPAPRDVLATAELLKLGTRLAVGRVTLVSDGDARPIAHAQVTYSIPPG